MIVSGKFGQLPENLFSTLNMTLILECMVSLSLYFLVIDLCV